MSKYRDTLKMVGVFASLSDDEVDLLANILLERRYRKGEMIFQKGEEADALYIVESGRLTATALDPKGNQRVLALYGPGDFFGEMALLSGQSRSATISSITDCTLLILRKEDFESFVRTNLRIMRPLLRVIAERQAENAALFAHDKAEDTVTVLGKVITVWSPKGGVGKTTVSSNLAIALREVTKKQVALLDASFSFGGVGPLLGLTSDRDTSDLIPRINELYPAVFESVMSPHPTGIRVLTAPMQPDFSQSLTGHHIQMMINKLCELFDYVVVDSSIALEEGTLAILDVSDLVVLLTTIEKTSLGNIKAFIRAGDALGYQREKILLVANRSDSTGGMRLEDAETFVGHHFAASIVSDGRLATHAMNSGEPLVIFGTGSRIAADLRNLAQAALTSLEGNTVVRLSSQVRRRNTGSGKPSSNNSGKGKASISRLLQSLSLGLGVMAVTSVLLLLVNLFVALVMKDARLSYPYVLSSGAVLLGAVFLGSFAALRLDQGSSRGWSIGLLLGLLYGVFAALVAAIVADPTSGSALTFTESFLMATPAFGLLGLLGGVLGTLGKAK